MRNTQTEKSELKTMAEKIVLPEFFEILDIWAETATKSEIKGLKIMNAITNSSGNKRFKQIVKKSSELNDSIVKEFRKNCLKTSYDSEFSKFKQNTNKVDILNYTKITEIKCSEIIRKEALVSLEKWLSFNEDQAYQSLILRFLRGLHLLIRSFLLKDHLNSSQKPRKSSMTTEKSLFNTGFPQISEKPLKSHKQKSLENYKGNGEITRWVSSLPATNKSLYQDSFLALTFLSKKPRKPDFSTSLVLKLLPNKP